MRLLRPLEFKAVLEEAMKFIQLNSKGRPIFTFMIRIRKKDPHQTTPLGNQTPHQVGILSPALDWNGTKTSMLKDNVKAPLLNKKIIDSPVDG